MPGPRRKPIADMLTLVSSGSPQRFYSNDLWVYSLTAEGHHSNSGFIFIGDSSDRALNTNDSTTRLGAQDTWNHDLETSRTIGVQINLRELWFDGSVSGDKLIIWYVK